ncbi:hypothetical protein [Maribacter hydrothermalis]|uniref:hypothetical protein n=1 Tax=Maribacter hydrothermalis TaxID=1836467 RepID=UPI0012FADD38|nr:hypothetical protein [Maribacter hydrothermalis]
MGQKVGMLRFTPLNFLRYKLDWKDNTIFQISACNSRNGDGCQRCQYLWCPEVVFTV